VEKADGKTPLSLHRVVQEQPTWVVAVAVARMGTQHRVEPTVAQA